MVSGPPALELWENIPWLENLEIVSNFYQMLAKRKFRLWRTLTAG
jgi:hypothetical protein